MSTEEPIKNKYVQKRIAKAFALVQLVNEVNMTSTKGRVPRELISKMVREAYNSNWFMRLFHEREIESTIDSIDIMLNESK